MEGQTSRASSLNFLHHPAEVGKRPATQVLVDCIFGLRLVSQRRFGISNFRNYLRSEMQLVKHNMRASPAWAIRDELLQLKAEHEASAALQSALSLLPHLFNLLVDLYRNI